MIKQVMKIAALFTFFFVLVSALGGTANCQASQETSVFGPRTYVRGTGDPETFVDSFSVINPEGEFRIYVQNGQGGAGKIEDAISSATVSVNGEEIIHTNDFNQTVGFIDREIANILINSENIVEVWLASKPGSFLIVEIFGTDQDTIPPVLNITSPADGANIYSDSPNITITYNDAESGINTSSFGVTVNGSDWTAHFAVTESQATYQIAPPNQLPSGDNVITATIADNVGNQAVDTSTFTVCTVEAIGSASPDSGVVPLTVNFTTSGSDPCGSIIQYQWDFDGNGTWDWSSILPQNVFHTYNAAETFNALLKVKSNSGFTDVDTVVIEVTPTGPTASASANPSNGQVPLTVYLTGSGSDPDGYIALYEWDFDGDGVYDWSSATTGNVTHTYSTVGTFQALFRVTDNDGLTDVADPVITEVRVGPPGSPTASASANPTSGDAPLTVSFAGSGTDPDGYIVLYEWDFDGDGVFDWSDSAMPEPSFSDDMEGGVGGWTHGGSVDEWELGNPTSGPGSAHSGNGCWATNLDGYYGNSADNWLTTPWIQFGNAPELTFWHYYDTFVYGGYYAIDGGWVEITTNGTSFSRLIPEGGYSSYSDYYFGGSYYSGSSGGWEQAVFDLSAYAGHNVQIRFRFASYYYSSDFGQWPGWYIDDVIISQRYGIPFTYNESGIFYPALRVTDNDGLTGKAVLQIMANFNLALSVSPAAFNPDAGEVTYLNTEFFGSQVQFTAFVKNKAGDVISTFVNNETRDVGSYSDPWDGTDDLGNTVPDGLYYFIVQCILSDGSSKIFDFSNTGGVESVPSRSFYQGWYSPYKDEFCAINYYLPQASEVSCYIGPYTAQERYRTLMLRVPKGPGSHTVIWDGLDDAGNRVPSTSRNLVTFWAYSIPDNAVVVEGGRPEISNVSAEPNYYDPSWHADEPVGYRSTVVTYTLSEQADMTLRVYNFNGVAIRTITQTSVPPGTNTIIWDGRNDEGEFVKDGEYHSGLQATDAAGQQSLVVYAFAVVYY